MHLLKKENRIIKESKECAKCLRRFVMMSKMELHGSILNRPDKLNAFIAQMNREVKDAIKAASYDEQVRCIVITGEGRAFCSGQDLSEVDEHMDHGQVLRDHYGPMIKQIRQCEKPIVAAVNGVAAGAGFSLALACDFRLISERASFVNAFIHVGLIPDSGNLYYLTQLVGHSKAAELAILGEKVPATEAVEMGLANRLIPSETWEEDVYCICSTTCRFTNKSNWIDQTFIEGDIRTFF